MVCVQHMRVPGSGCASPKDIDGSWTAIQTAALKSLVLSGNARPDGRGFADARHPSSQVSATFPFSFRPQMHPPLLLLIFGYPESTFNKAET
jgi:hypothetical protein